MAHHYMRWTLSSSGSMDNLDYGSAPVPAEVGPEDVLVELQAASLNYRDIVIAKVPTCPRDPHGSTSVAR